MKIYYQWEPGAYSNIASIDVAKELGVYEDCEIEGLDTFESVWQKISEGHIWVLPIENSYAGPIHANLFAFSRIEASIIGTYNLEINHCLLSLEDDITKVKTAISHPQALDQTYHYMKNHNITRENFYDTAWAAKHISENNVKWYGAISSRLAAEIYGLNILEEGIQDQSWNTTRFLVVCLSKDREKYSYKTQKNKTSLLIEARHIPASLYKCLGAFATNNVNLTKIENLPSFWKPFEMQFWIDIEWRLDDENIQKAIHELDFFTSEIRILGEY